MHQQRSAVLKHIIVCFNCLPLSLTYVPSLKCYWSIIWPMTVCWMLDQSSFRNLFNSSTSRTEF